MGLRHERDELVVRVAELGLHDDRGAADVEWVRGAAQPRPRGPARKKLVDDVMVEVAAPDGRLRNAHTAPSVSASVITAPPCMRPAVVHRSGAQARWPRTSSFDAASIVIPTATANGMVATRSREIHPTIVGSAA